MSENIDRAGRDLEENLREAADLSRAMHMLLTGLCAQRYPSGIGDDDKAALCQLASEIRDRAESANKQWIKE